MSKPRVASSVPQGTMAYIQEHGTQLSILSLGRRCGDLGFCYSWQHGGNFKKNEWQEDDHVVHRQCRSSRSGHPATCHSVYQARPRKGETEETVLKLLEPFSERLIDNDAVLVRRSRQAEKETGGNHIAEQNLFDCDRCGRRPLRCGRNKGERTCDKESQRFQTNHKEYTHFPTTPDCEVCGMTKTTARDVNIDL